MNSTDIPKNQKIQYQAITKDVVIIKYSRLVILTSLISNNRLSRSDYLVPVLTWKSNNRWQNIVEKRTNCSWGAISPLFHNIFNRSIITSSFVKCGCKIYLFLNSANQICRGTDTSKYFKESLGLRDNESGLYICIGNKEQIKNRKH